MSDGVDQRFAPPEAEVADMGTDGPELASRWMRWWAAVIDSLILGFAGYAIGRLPLVATWLTASAGDPTNVWGVRPAAPLLGFALLLIVNGWLLVKQGQTIGKLVCGMKIVRTDGSQADAWRVLGLRYGSGSLIQVVGILGAFYYLIDALLIFRDSRRCLHDSIADTKVIKL